MAFTIDRWVKNGSEAEFTRHPFSNLNADMLGAAVISEDQPHAYA